MHEDILILHHFYYDTDENDEMGFLDALEFFGGLRIEYFEAFLKVINFGQISLYVKDFIVGNTENNLLFGTKRGFLFIGEEVAGGTFQNGK